MSSFGDEAPTLIKTKLRRPRLDEDLLQRPQLIKHLNRGRDRKLTLISAQAGAGKSTLLAQWLQDCPQPSAWLSLDEHDNDLVVFATYFCAAIQTVFPDACEHVLDLLHAPQAPPPRIITSSLVNELTDLCESRRSSEAENEWKIYFILALDDYHNIKEPTIHELVSELITYLPQCTHLVMTSRTDPPLPLTGLRAKKEMSELRTNDLQFTMEEARMLLEVTAGRELSNETVKLLTEKTDGWAVGLRLSALSLRDYPDDKKFGERFKGTSNPVMMDFLVGDVLSQRSPGHQDFLLRTSFLDRFNADLCDEVLWFENDDYTATYQTGKPQSGTILRGLKSANLFLLPLDQEEGWFRYHHLFRDLLQHRLQRQYEPEYIRSLHVRASLWFEKNGHIDEALSHAFSADDLDRAVRIVSRQRYRLMNQARWQRLDRYYRQFPAEYADQQPDLLLLKTWLVYHIGHYNQLPPLLEQLEVLLDNETFQAESLRYLKGEISSLKSLLYYYQSNAEQAVEESEISIRDTAPELWIVRILARLFRAGGYLMRGKVGLAYESYYEGLDKEIIQSNRFKATLLMSSCYIHWVAGDLQRLEASARQCIALSDFPHASEIRGFGEYHLGRVHYSKNELDLAEAHLSTVVQQPHTNYGLAFSDSVFSLGLIYQARNQLDKAREMASLAVAHMIGTGNTSLLLVAHAFTAEIALRQNQLATANQWADQFESIPPFLPMSRVYEPHFTLAKIWLARGTLHSRQQAAELLDGLRQYTESTHQKVYLIQVLVLQAILQAAEDKEPDALILLEKAIDLAQVGGFIRIFADLGPPMAHLLNTLRDQGTSPDYINQILIAFHEPALDHGQQAAGVRPKLPVELNDPLTPRELEVLELLSKRQTNREIAEELVVSLGTVKTHTLSIYTKLDVHSRREAVDKAIELGLLALS